MEPGQDANYVYDLLRVEMPQNQPHPQLPGISSVSLASTSDALFAPAHYGGLVVEYNPVILRFDAPFYSETAHLISQGPNQKPTHEGFLRNDIDFTMGKFDVAASAGGIVRIFDPCDGAADQDACTLGLEKNNDFGKFVTIDHMVSGLNPSDRIFTVYAHLDSVVSSLRDGDYVQAGQLLGVQGRTGFATGNHIHWGIFSGDPSIDPLTLPRDERETAWTPVGVREGFPLIMGVSGESAARKFTTNEDISSLVCPDARNPQSYGCRYVFSMLERTSDENFSGFIDEGESYLFSLFASNSTLLSGNLTWPGSELALDIFNPLGDLFGSLSERDGLISFSIDDPMDGLWSFRVTGIETRPGGEPFTFIARSENDTSAVAPVPLPAAGWLLVGALGALAATRRRKPAAAAAS